MNERLSLEVRDLLRKHFNLEYELILPVSLKPYEAHMTKEPINYACILRHQNGTH